MREREREDNASTFVCEREMEEEIKMRKCLCVCFTHRSETRSVIDKDIQGQAAVSVLRPPPNSGIEWKIVVPYPDLK